MSNLPDVTLIDIVEYRWESKKYPKFQTILLDKTEQDMILEELSFNFKVDQPYIIEYKKDEGGYFTEPRTIGLNPIAKLGHVIHEFSHYLSYRRYSHCEHNSKEFIKTVQEVYKWSEWYLK